MKLKRKQLRTHAASTKYLTDLTWPVDWDSINLFNAEYDELPTPPSSNGWVTIGSLEEALDKFDWDGSDWVSKEDGKKYILKVTNDECL